jgi:Fuc2NAc and GlcNAc transferase
MTATLLLLAVFVASLVGTGILRRYAIARRLLDIPNERSSHATPTPRGGGVAIVVSFVGGVLVLASMGLVAPRTAVATVGGGLLVAAVGFLDDQRHVAPLTRLVAHFLAAIWAVAWLGGLPPVHVFGSVLQLGLAGDALAVIALVWMLNLFNFMDGIDGIAGVEAVTVCAGAAILYSAHLEMSREVLVPGVLAVASLGFLVWNMPPAKIFMGDAGSGFLGLMIGVLAIQAAAVSPNWLWCWTILSGVFVVDATVTLCRRARRRERVYEAHRSHAYQHAAIRVGGHRPVTLAVAAINWLWLLPIALLVSSNRLDGAVGVLIAYTPLVFLVTRLRAGLPQTP